MSKPRPAIILHLNAGRSGSGNPRRCFVVMAKLGEIIDVIDEGYEGSAAVRKKYPHTPVTDEIDTTPANYRRLLRLGEERRSTDDKGAPAP